MYCNHDTSTTPFSLIIDYVLFLNKLILLASTKIGKNGWFVVL